MFETKLFRNFVFASMQNCFVLVSFRFELTSSVTNFASKSKQFRFVMRSKLNDERLDLSRVTRMLYTRVAANTPSGYLSSSHEFSKEDDDTDD